MSLSYTEYTTHQVSGSGGTITSPTMTVATGDVIVMLVAYESGALTWSLGSPAKASGTAAIGSFAAATIAGNTSSGAPVVMTYCTVTAGGTLALSAAVTGITPTEARYLACIQITGAAATPVPAGNVFSGSGATGNISQAITPTNANGSLLWLWAADWAESHSFAAGASCTLDVNYTETGVYDVALLRPTTQPRTDGSAFTLALNETAAKTSWIAFEVVSATGAPDVLMPQICL